MGRQKRDSKRGTHEMLTVRQTNRRTREKKTVGQTEERQQERYTEDADGETDKQANKGKENSWADRRETAREVHTRC